MTRSDIIELANQLTERKGEKVLNLNLLFAFVCQDICKRERFWWRRVQVNFSMTIGTATYDLTNATLFPGLAEIAMEEITKFTIITAPNPLQTAELSPVSDPETLIEMQQNVSNLQPIRYTMNPNDYKTILVDPPDAAYNSYIIGWGMPNPATDTTTGSVPLIPPWGHNTVVHGLKAQIFEFLYGSSNAKTVDAVARYEQGITDLAERKRFDPNYKSQLNLNERAIRST